MPINTEQYKNQGLSGQDRKAIVEANLRRLDYAEGNGLLSKAKKELLPGELYLFISSGGTGQKALRSIKETINKTIDPNYHAQVRYLVVDCAENELLKLVEDGVFEQSEIMLIPYQGAHDTISPQHIAPDKKEWVDPDLYSATGGGIPGMHPGFESDGAGAWRQPGRVRLTSTGGINVINKIQEVINGIQYPARTKLKVFFLCSVAGGTGSGTIVDLVYMTRHVLETNFAGLYNNTRIFGYIFSPSACEGGINEDRNPGANHYAAMKEIAYLMRLGDRGEKIKMNYGITNVTFNRNIFDTCMIVDCDTPAFGGFNNPAKTARNVVVQSILGSMTARDVVGGERVSLVDSIYSNRSIEVNTAIASLPLDRYPRYAGYSFNAAGFASVKVPVELLTSVVVHNIFEKLWNAWNEDPGKNAHIRFLNDCGIEEARRIANIQSKNELLERVEQKSREFIRRHGIMAMINVAREAVRLLENEYIPYARDKAKSVFFKESWIKTTHLLTAVKYHLIGLNNTVWETSKIVLETFHDLLERESGILTDVNIFERNFNRTLYFCPINLTQSMATQRQANALMEFITGIYEGREDRIIEDFIDEILLTDNLAKLAGVTSTDAGISAQFDPAGMIRSFIERRFETIINENIEIFLVKFFSGNPQAETTQPDPNEPARQIASDDLKRAAREIYNTLTTKGAAMANTLGGIENRVSGRRFITVPKTCTHLFEEIERCANADSAKVKVYKSESDDELLMITMLQGLPALSFQTTAQNEPVYEAHWNGFPGIHIEQCGSGIHNWVNLPNLVFNGNQPREQRNLRAAKDDYDAAVALGMVMNSPNYPDQQIKSIFRLNKTQDVGSVTERWMIPEFEDYITDSLPNSLNDLNLEYCLNQLEQNGVVSRVDLMQHGDNRSAIGSELPADFYYDYAWHTLRQMFHLWHAVKETIPYVAELSEAIQRKKARLH
ncbi:MAG: tubulin-like doman-containing protein [Christensenellales bacterium]